MVEDFRGHKQHCASCQRLKWRTQRKELRLENVKQVMREGTLLQKHPDLFDKQTAEKPVTSCMSEFASIRLPNESRDAAMPRGAPKEPSGAANVLLAGTNVSKVTLVGQCLDPQAPVCSDTPTVTPAAPQAQHVQHTAGTAQVVDHVTQPEDEMSPQFGRTAPLACDPVMHGAHAPRECHDQSAASPRGACAPTSHAATNVDGKVPQTTLASPTTSKDLSSGDWSPVEVDPSQPQGGSRAPSSAGQAAGQQDPVTDNACGTPNSNSARSPPYVPAEASSEDLPAGSVNASEPAARAMDLSLIHI